MKTLTYILDPNEVIATLYRGKSSYPIARFERSPTPHGWELRWVDPQSGISVKELKQLARIGKTLRAGELPATASFVDITKEK